MGSIYGVARLVDVGSALSPDEMIDAYYPDPMKWAGRLIEKTLLKNDPYQDNVTVVIASALE